MTKHAKLSASASERWINCPASVKQLENAPRKTSSFAEEGTAAHELAEKCLTLKKSASEFIGETIHNHVIDAEMAGFTQSYIDYVLSHNGIMHVEQRVDFSKYVPEGFGTADALIIDTENKHLHIIDLKFGRGVAVYAENNTQGQLYALGAYLKLKNTHLLENFTIHIHQPRIGNISTWTFSKSDLKDFALFVKGKAEAALLDNAPFNPTEKGCRWCDMKPTCLALAKKTYDIITADFDDLTIEVMPPQPSGLTPSQINALLLQIPLVENWIKSVKEHAYALAETNQLESFKLVAGRNSRKWTLDDNELIEALNGLGIDPIKTDIVSVAQAEKLITKEQKTELAKLYKSVVGQPTIVPVQDKRHALQWALDFFESV